MQSGNQVTVYFDGLCRVCSLEINHYRRMRGSENLLFLDITAPDFEPMAHGLDPKSVHKVMHAKDKTGQLHSGVDAFRVIWQQLPSYQFMARWSESGLVRIGLDFGYDIFVKVRPFLPRRKADCSTSPYCEVTK